MQSRSEASAFVRGGGAPPPVKNVYSSRFAPASPRRRRDLAVELLFVHRLQNLAHAAARLDTEREQVAAEENRRRRAVLHTERARAIEKPVHGRAVEAAGLAAHAISLRDAGQQFEIHLVREPPEGAVAHLVADLEPGARLEVLRHEPDDLLTDVVAIERVHVEPIEQRVRRRDALLLVIHRSDAAVDDGRRRRLAEVVAEGAQHDGHPLRTIEIVDAPPRLIHHLQRVHPHVALGVPFGFLRTAGERLQFWKQRADDAELHRERQADRRARRQQQLFDFAPDSFGRQIVERNIAAQLAGHVVERELEPRRELHGAQHSQAVVAERRRIDHAEKPPLDVPAAVAGIQVLA